MTLHVLTLLPLPHSSVTTLRHRKVTGSRVEMGLLIGTSPDCWVPEARLGKPGKEADHQDARPDHPPGAPGDLAACMSDARPV